MLSLPGVTMRNNVFTYPEAANNTNPKTLDSSRSSVGLASFPKVTKKSDPIDASTDTLSVCFRTGLQMSWLSGVHGFKCCLPQKDPILVESCAAYSCVPRLHLSHNYIPREGAVES